MGCFLMTPGELGIEPPGHTATVTSTDAVSDWVSSKGPTPLTGSVQPRSWLDDRSVRSRSVARTARKLRPVLLVLLSRRIQARLEGLVW
jgi:hypothetical protein